MTPQASGSGFDASGMSSDANTNLTPQLAIGIFIILAGVFLALDSLNVLEVEGFFRLWPAVVIAIGGSMLAKRDDPKSRFWGGVLVFLGSWLLLNTLGLVRVGFWDLFWPLLLIGLGVKLVMRAMNLDMGGSASTAGTNLFAVMGESKRTNSDHPFRGGQMTAFMGGCQLDLRAASILPGEEAVIDVLAVMGGLEVWVPGNWTVVSQVVPIMGGVEDKRLPMLAAPVMPMGTPGSEPAVNTAPARLVLRGYVVMGGLVIKN